MHISPDRLHDYKGWPEQAHLSELAACLHQGQLVYVSAYCCCQVTFLEMYGSRHLK
jgi:hypothetical protein